MRHHAAHALATAGFIVISLVSSSLPVGAVEIIPAPAPQQAGAARTLAAAKPDEANRRDEAKKSEEAKKKPDSMDGRCDVCGSCTCVHKVCVPRPKEREIKKTCWSYKCEDFCIPGPSEYCGRQGGKPDDCGCWSFDAWKPTCAEVRTRKVPVKTEVKRKVPGVEWTPEERCAACRCRKAHETCPTTSSAP